MAAVSKVASVTQTNLHAMERVTALYQDVMGEDLHWGLFADDTDTLHAAQKCLIDRIAESAGVDTATRVLDIGCGVGGTALHLAQRYGCPVVGITNSAVGFGIAERRVRNCGQLGVELRLEDALQTNLPDRAFDVAICIESVSMIPDPNALLRTLRRLVRPGGRLVIADSFVCRMMPAGELAQRSQEVQALQMIFGVGTYSKLEDYVRQLHGAGFQQVSCLDVTRQVLPTADHVVSKMEREWSVLSSRYDPSLVQAFLLSWKFGQRVFAGGFSSYSIIRAA
ncbi:MAG TPA: methyltransferase domain-containing protein [Steroidobacteraceae bacterium]